MAEKIGIRSATVTIRDGKVLLVNSKYDDGEYYLFPGGGVEFGETIEEGAIRETFEETGFKVKIEKLIHINEFIYKEDWNKRSITAFFLASPKEESLENISNDNGKIKTVEWIDISKLEDLDIRPEILSKILKEYKEDLNKIVSSYSVDFKE
ncbi:MAG: NUDIX hydrolase [Candidatus Pacearchaeota archaeon]